MTQGLFISGTGTGIGKTMIARGLAYALHCRGVNTAAIKPIETGVQEKPDDACALALACGKPELAFASGLYRSRPPVAPYAAELMGEDPIKLPELIETLCHLSRQSNTCIVEGAGGLLVPLTSCSDICDLAAALGFPLLLVSTDRLGTLSHTLSAAECAVARGLKIAAVVLNRYESSDPSSEHNFRILQERLHCPVLCFPKSANDNVALGAVAERSGLVQCLFPNAAKTKREV